MILKEGKAVLCHIFNTRGLSITMQMILQEGEMCNEIVPYYHDNAICAY